VPSRAPRENTKTSVVTNVSGGLVGLGRVPGHPAGAVHLDDAEPGGLVAVDLRGDDRHAGAGPGVVVEDLAVVEGVDVVGAQDDDEVGARSRITARCR